jgi:hypothetical protein
MTTFAEDVPLAMDSKINGLRILPRAKAFGLASASH